MKSASQIQRVMAALCFGIAALSACAVADAPSTEGISAAADAGAPEADGGAGSAPRGAGMPLVPIHRADAGAKTSGVAMQMPMNAQTADAAQPVAAPDASDLDAGSAEPASMPQADASTSQPSAATLPEPLHRYSFSGGGVSVPDAQGGKDALIKGGAMLDGQNAVVFDPKGDGVVELPADTFADVSDFSVLVWLAVRSDTCWQRALDLTFAQQVAVMGPSSGPGGPGGQGPGGQGPGQPPSMTRTEIVSLYLTPFGCPDELPILGYVTSSSKYHLLGKQRVPQGQAVLLGLTYSARSQALRLIIDGEVVNEQRVPLDLHALHRARAWLGRSYAADDPTLDGSISELRVYESALDASTLSQIHERGPDAL